MAHLTPWPRPLNHHRDKPICIGMMFPVIFAVINTIRSISTFVSAYKIANGQDGSLMPPSVIAALQPSIAPYIITCIQPFASIAILDLIPTFFQILPLYLRVVCASSKVEAKLHKNREPAIQRP